MLNRTWFISGGCWIVCLFLGLAVPRVYAERIFFAGYKGGFYIKSEEEGGMELRFGGAFQTDYRYYLESVRADNRFDVRRARILFNGRLTQYFQYGMQFEFQGNETDNLVDAWGEWGSGLNRLRFGQFKQPFSLEWQTRDKGLFFAERSMGHGLSPDRDIGIMLHGRFLPDNLFYALGLFNGDGDDGATRGDAHDEPEVSGRLVFLPFKWCTLAWLKDLQLGGAFTAASMDQANIHLSVKSTGMYGISRSIYELTHNTKFGVIQDTGRRFRLGAEMAWSWGPFAVMGEYLDFRYTDLKPAGHRAMDANFNAGYVSCVFFPTGEPVILSEGCVKPVYPNHFFNPEQGTWGAVGIGLRREYFRGDPDWIRGDAYVSVEEADAASVAVNWILFPMFRFIFDFTQTRFSDQVRVRVLETGQVDYIRHENVFTARFSMDF